jgi:glycosyltransferase involved in cell wall biosynthesis
MSSSLVSVVIPTYNSAEYIEEALNSVFEQTFNEFEIIVIDDGSTDNTRTILDKYSGRIKYFYQNNKGPAGARNHGIEEVTGKYIAFLDADDIWMPAKLEKQVALFRQREGLGMVTTGVCSFDDKGVFGFSTDKREKLMQGDIARNIFLKSDIGTPTVMVPKIVFDKVGLFEENIRYGEDDNMWIRIASHYDVELIDEALVKVRNHPRRATRDQLELQQAVLENIQMLKTKYGDVVRRRIEKAIPRKISQVQFAIGYNHYERGNFREARKAFLRAAYHRLWFWKNSLYLILTFLPPGLTNLMKRIKRKLAPEPLEGVKRRR